MCAVTDITFFGHSFLHACMFIEKSVSLSTQLNQFTNKLKGKEVLNKNKVKFSETDESCSLYSHNCGVTDITFWALRTLQICPLS